MKSAAKAFVLSFLLLGSSFSIAQCRNGENDCRPAVPRLLKFNGRFRDSKGNPRTGIVGVMFLIYADSVGGIPLWQETQNVQLDSEGHYSVLLGANTSGGIPVELFRGGEPRWLAAQAILPDELEQPRILLVSVPYALKAADAETLGGLPASAFVRLPSTEAAPSGSIMDTPTAKSSVQTTVAVPGAAAAPNDVPVMTPGGTPNTIPKFSLSPGIVNSQISDANGVVTLQNLANIFFADQFSDGVPGAVAACPAEGCTIYAGSETVNRNLGTIDPQDKIITIYLGPFTYNVKQITLRKSLRIIGMGASIPGTILQSVNGNNPVFVIPQGNNLPVTNVLLSGLRIIGSVGNTSEDAFFIDSSTLVNSGLWYSELRDLYIYNFAGNGIHLRGPGTNFGAITQWTQFNNVFVTRTTGGGNALRIEGANFQLHFTNCEFDGPGIGDGTNIYIGGLPGGSNFSFPFDITFRGLVTQAAAVAVQMDGAETITFQTSHHELVWGVYLITGNSNIWNRDISITDSVFNSVGQNNGAGYLVNVATSLAQGVYFVHNRLNAADSVVTAVNSAQVVYQDNEYLGTLDVPPTSGITPQISAASTINIGGAHSVGIAPNPSGKPITTIQSSLGPGETVTFAAIGGTVAFATGGNIALPGASIVAVNGTITFIRSDLTGAQAQWWPVSQWMATSSGQPSPAFSLSLGDSQSSATVTAGETANYDLMVIPSGGFSGSVQFSCAGFPKASTCTVSPNPLVLTASSPTSVSVAVKTTAASLVVTESRAVSSRPRPLELDQLLFGVIGILIMFPVGTRESGTKRGRTRKATCIARFLLLIIPSTGCGAVANTTEPPTPVATPSGTYALVVTGASASLHKSIALTLKVQ